MSFRTNMPLIINGFAVRYSLSCHIAFVVTDHEIISTDLIQKGQLSVTGESMSTKYW